jgi:hypothetical protein
MKAIIVNTMYQLMEAIQIRKSYLANDDVECILTDAMGEFGSTIFEKKKLASIFTDVSYGKLKEYHVTIKKLLNPKMALKEITGKEPVKYTDIFFWNNDLIAYNYYKWYSISKYKVKWHLYGDAMASYIFDSPDSKNSAGWYSRDEGVKAYVANFVDNLIFDFKRFADLDYDYYIFKKNMFLKNTTRKLKDIPIIDINNSQTMEIYNEIYCYKGYKVKQKYIYLDTARDGYISDEDVLKIIQKFIDAIGKNNLIVKPHPRVDERIYLNLGVEIFDKDIPWEIYSMNNNLSDKAIICSFTSAAVLPYILYGMKYQIVSVGNLISNKSPNLDDMRYIFNKINEQADNIIFINNNRELEIFLRNIR